MSGSVVSNKHNIKDIHIHNVSRLLPIIHTNLIPLTSLCFYSQLALWHITTSYSLIKYLK